MYKVNDCFMFLGWFLASNNEFCVGEKLGDCHGITGFFVHSSIIFGLKSFFLSLMISHDFFEDMTGETKINTAKCTTSATSHTKVLLNEFVKVLVKNSQIFLNFLRNYFCLYWVFPLGIVCLNVCS